MAFRNTPETYGTVTKTLHWAMALIIIALLAMGLLMGDVEDLNTKLTLYGLHKSLGVTVLILAALRILWHVISRRPKAVETLNTRDRLAAGAMHYFLYFLMIAMPMTGWLMSSAAGRPVSFFGLFTLPDLIPANPAEREVFGGRHETIAYILMGCIALHAGAALMHHFFKKDGVLRRMLPMLALALLLPVTAQAAEKPAGKWTVIHDKSHILFKPMQMGSAFEGRFNTFSSDIVFDPDNLAEAKAVIVVQVATASTGATDRDENLKTPDWFNAAAFPEARFETQSFRKGEKDGHFIADGTLTIKGASLPVTLPFTLAIVTDGQGIKTATVEGGVTLDRAKFQVGTGQWADTSIIANDVPVEIKLTALSR